MHYDVFETIWNSIERNENSVSKAFILSFLKRFGTAQKKRKHILSMHGLGWVLLHRYRNFFSFSLTFVMTPVLKLTYFDAFFVYTT